MAQADGSLIQTDDIYRIKLLGSNCLVHVAYPTSELTALHWNGWLAFTREVCSMLSELLKPSTLPCSTCIDLLWVSLFAICVPAVGLKYSQHRIGSSKFLFLICSSSTNLQQQQFNSSSVADRLRPNTLTLSYPLPCSNLPRVVMIEINVNQQKKKSSLFLPHNWKKNSNFGNNFLQDRFNLIQKNRWNFRFNFFHSFTVEKI